MLREHKWWKSRLDDIFNKAMTCALSHSYIMSYQNLSRTYNDEFDLSALYQEA